MYMDQVEISISEENNVELLIAKLTQNYHNVMINK